jgi:ABC-type nitrate/sulfonate/bicarbonate transport system permease component
MSAKAVSRRGLHVRSMISVLTIIVLWEAVARAGLTPALFLPPFTKVISEWWAVCADGSLPLDLAVSLSRAAAGLGLAAAVGVPLGIAMARSRFLHWLFDPVVALAFPSPKIAFLPIFILWFGIYSLSKILLVAFACVFPILVGGVARDVASRHAVSHRAAGRLAADFRRPSGRAAGIADHDLYGRDGLWRRRDGRNPDVLATLLRKPDRIRLYPDRARRRSAA